MHGTENYNNNNNKVFLAQNVVDLPPALGVHYHAGRLKASVDLKVGQSDLNFRRYWENQKKIQSGKKKYSYNTLCV